MGQWLQRAWEDSDGNKCKFQVILSKTGVKEAGGHSGISKTLEKVRDCFYWIGSRSDIDEWCRNRTTCAAIKGLRTRSREIMRQYIVGAHYKRT